MIMYESKVIIVQGSTFIWMYELKVFHRGVRNTAVEIKHVRLMLYMMDNVNFYSHTFTPSGLLIFQKQHIVFCQVLFVQRKERRVNL